MSRHHEYLPHRHPFLLIDRIVEVERKKRIVAIKTSLSRTFFYWPAFRYPIMPGVLVVESIAQAGGVLLLSEIPDRETSSWFYVSNARKFRRPVVPGDQLRIGSDGDQLRRVPCACKAGYCRWQAYLQAVVMCQARAAPSGRGSNAAESARNRYWRRCARVSIIRQRSLRRTAVFLSPAR